MRVRLPDGTSIRSEAIDEELYDLAASGNVSSEGLRETLKSWFPGLSSDPVWMREKMEELEDILFLAREEKGRDTGGPR